MSNTLHVSQRSAHTYARVHTHRCTYTFYATITLLCLYIVPETSIHNLTFPSFNSTSISVRWDIRDGNKFNGPSQLFLIKYYPTDKGDANIKRANTSNIVSLKELLYINRYSVCHFYMIYCPFSSCRNTLYMTWHPILFTPSMLVCIMGTVLVFPVKNLRELIGEVIDTYTHVNTHDWHDAYVCIQR